MGEQLKMLTRTVMVCLLATLTYQKAIQKNHTISLLESNQNPRKHENLFRGRRSTNLPPRITFRTEIAMTRRMLNQFNGNKRQAENWVRAKVQDANRIFKHHTLHTKLTIEVVNERNIKIVEENMAFDSKLLGVYNRYVGGKYPLAVFGLGGGGGWANRETACPNTRYGVSSYMITEHPYPSNTGGQLLAHEIGHVIGMKHNPDRGCGSPRDGIMNRAVYPYATQWTSCNNEDLEKYYNEEGGYTCL